MSLGFRAAGARCLGAVEWNQPAADTFTRTFGDDQPRVFGGPEAGDVNKLPVRDLLDALDGVPDVVMGGPPCQGFSRIGRAKHASLLAQHERTRLGGVRDVGRNLLYQYFLEVVREARPRAFVMENVPGMREQMGNDFARRISREAHALGYNVRYFLLNAADYGVPQHRWRIFFVGLRSDLGVTAIPQPPPRTHRAEGALEGTALPEDPWLIAGPDVPTVPEPATPVTVRDAIGDLPKLKQHLAGERPKEERLPLRRRSSAYVEDLRRWPGVPTPDSVSGNWHRYLGGMTERQDYKIFELMAQGDRYPEVIEIGHRLLNEHLATLASPPVTGTMEWEALKARFVPRYRRDAFHDKWRKLVADEPSWTVTAHLSRDAYSHIHYDSRQARTITVREAARLQSFPDGVEFCGNFGEQYQQIGNAVPPVLARAIARSLFAQLTELDEAARNRAVNTPTVASTWR
jgi:DNA (cytosine-5)-methyltransferase 1